MMGFLHYYEKLGFILCSYIIRRWYVDLPEEICSSNGVEPMYDEDAIIKWHYENHPEEAVVVHTLHRLHGPGMDWSKLIANLTTD